MSLLTNASSTLWSYVAGQLTDRAENVVEAASDCHPKPLRLLLSGSDTIIGENTGQPFWSHEILFEHISELSEM